MLAFITKIYCRPDGALRSFQYVPLSQRMREYTRAKLPKVLDMHFSNYLVK